MLENQTNPNYKPADARHLIEPMPVSAWEYYSRPDRYAMVTLCYLDRIGPEMFVSRKAFGNCDAITAAHNKRRLLEGAYEEMKTNAMYHIAWNNRFGRASHIDKGEGIMHIKHARHAYVITITPDKVECNCIYCGSNMQYTVQDYENEEDIPTDIRNLNPKNMCWDEPWSKPRRATQREITAVYDTHYNDSDRPDLMTSPIADQSIQYFDRTFGNSIARMRCGTCSQGGQHDAMVHYATFDSRTYPLISYCIFCREEWYGPPEGFETTFGWGKGDITVQQAIEQHAKAKARGEF